MFPFRRKKARPGYVGLEVRADGLALSWSRPDGKGENKIVSALFCPCNAAERETKLAELVKEHALEGMACNLTLPFDQYQTFPIEKPKVENAELAEAARWKVKDLLDYDLENAVTDVYAFPNDALRGRPEQLNVVACRRAIVQGNVDLVNASDLELESIDIADLALRNVAMRIASDSERPVALLYLRNGAGMMVLVKGDTLYLARHFDFSLQALNEASQQESVMQHLSLEIQRSFDYFESQLGQVPPQDLVLFGPDPSIPLANMLGGSISARVQALDPSLFRLEPAAIDFDQINGFVAMGGALREVRA